MDDRNVGATPSKWVRREHPKIDRIACPWLISRFIDPNAEFIYVPKDQVLAVTQRTGGIPYDIDGVEFTHEGERCSFDTILRIYEIRDPALDHLATIGRGADTSRHDLNPQCGGLFAISLGLSANFPDDHEMLKHGMVIYDVLYTWCRTCKPRRTIGRPSCRPDHAPSSTLASGLTKPIESAGERDQNGATAQPRRTQQCVRCFGP
jgi:hypothetical protein